MKQDMKKPRAASRGSNEDQMTTGSSHTVAQADAPREGGDAAGQEPHGQ